MSYPLLGQGFEPVKITNYDRAGLRDLGSSITTCDARVRDSREKLSDSKGFEKQFLLWSLVNEANDGRRCLRSPCRGWCSIVECFDSSSEECSELDSSFDGLNLNEAVFGGVMNEEFILNQMGKRVHEYFQNEFDNFIESFP